MAGSDLTHGARAATSSRRPRGGCNVASVESDGIAPAGHCQRLSARPRSSVSLDEVSFVRPSGVRRSSELGLPGFGQQDMRRSTRRRSTSASREQEQSGADSWVVTRPYGVLTQTARFCRRRTPLAADRGIYGAALNRGPSA
jgi:hypothetical protein